MYIIIYLKNVIKSCAKTGQIIIKIRKCANNNSAKMHSDILYHLHAVSDYKKSCAPSKSAVSQFSLKC